MTGDDGVAALRADGLGRRYGRVWGLRDCTFAVPAGSVVGLVGPNGAGKTTLLSLTVGLLAPTEGKIAVFGEPSLAQSAGTLSRVSYLAQDHPLYRGFTVADMAALNAQLRAGDFILGADFSAADVLWGSALGWTTMFGLVPETPEIKAYIARITTRPAAVRVREQDAVLAAQHKTS